VNHVRVGVPGFVSVRPLIFGFTRRQAPEVELEYLEPGLLADVLGRGQLEAALLPSIEFLSGAGKYFLEGPALIARPSTGSVLLLTRKPVEAVERIAVSEFCRSPVTVTRIVLAEMFGVTPDLCVCKNIQGNWREEYDGILLSGDRGLQYLAERPEPDALALNIAELWQELTALPLVLGLWVYNNGALKGRLTKIMVLSRNLGMRNLSRLADGISHTSQYDNELIYDYLSNCWDYQLTDEAMKGLKALEEYALRYDLIRESRLSEITTS
jgi:chorismate dehydratase